MNARELLQGCIDQPERLARFTAEHPHLLALFAESWQRFVRDEAENENMQNIDVFSHQEALSAEKNTYKTDKNEEYSASSIPVYKVSINTEKMMIFYHNKALSPVKNNNKIINNDKK